ncbi:MAG: CsgG/HfaB family protein [Planctomycetota bacterium]|jgi:hypothetical protein
MKNNTIVVILISIIVLTTANVFASEQSGKDLSVAINNFTAHDNSYRSRQAAANFSQMLHVALTKRSPFKWVEREEISNALNELKMGVIGLQDSTSALQIGRWLQADLIIKGDFYRNEKQRWTLIIEVIDLPHADILVRRTITLRSVEKEFLSLRSATVERIRRQIALALKLAERRLRETKNKVLVAPLFFQNERPGGRLDFYEKDLMAAFAGAGKTLENIRFIQFPRAAESIPEAELAVLGLVENEPDAWQEVADFYVWGSYREVESSGIPFGRVTVEATVTIWDGVRKPKEFSDKSIVAELSNLSNRLITNIGEYSQLKPDKTRQTNIRSKIARDLSERARDIQELVLQKEYDNYPNVSKTWRKRRKYAIEILSVACFFDPANEDLRTKLLVENMRDDVDYLSIFRQNMFWRKWSRSIAWKKHCEKFGFNYEHAHMPELKWRKGLADNRLFYDKSAHQYVNTVLVLIEECEDFETRSKSHTSIPHDIPWEVVQQWKAELSTEYTRRLHRVATECPEKLYGCCTGKYILTLLRNSQDKHSQLQIIEALWPDAKKDTVIWHRKEFVGEKILEVFTAGGNRQRGEQLIAMLPQEDPREIGKVQGGGTYIGTKKHLLEKYGRSASKKQSSAKTRHKRTGRQGAYDRFGDKIPAKIDAGKGKTQKIQINDIPVVNAEIKSVSFEEHFYVQEVTSMMNVGDHLWVGVKGLFMKPEIIQGSTMILRDLSQGRNLDLSDRFGNHSQITSMHLDRNILWLTFSAEGVWAVDTRTLKARKYSTRDGLTSNKIYCSCAYGPKLYFGGGIDQEASLCAFDTKTRTWTGYDVPKVTWFNRQVNVPHITKVEADSQWLAAYGHYGGTRTTLMIFNFARGNWTEAAFSLLRQNPEFSDFSKGRRLDINALAIDDEGIWIGTSQGLVMLSPDTMRYDYLCRLPFEVSSILDGGNYLWLGCTYNPKGPRHIDKSVMKCHVVLFNKKTRKYSSRAQLPYNGAISEMVLINKNLWVGISGNRKHTLVSVDLKAF